MYSSMILLIQGSVFNSSKKDAGIKKKIPENNEPVTKIVASVLRRVDNDEKCEKEICDYKPQRCFA